MYASSKRHPGGSPTQSNTKRTVCVCFSFSVITWANVSQDFGVHSIHTHTATGRAGASDGVMLVSFACVQHAQGSSATAVTSNRVVDHPQRVPLPVHPHRTRTPAFVPHTLSRGAPRWPTGTCGRVHGYYRFHTRTHRLPTTLTRTTQHTARAARQREGEEGTRDAMPQTGATIGSILIGSGRTRGAPPRVEVCDVSIIMLSLSPHTRAVKGAKRSDQVHPPGNGSAINLVSIHIRCNVIRPS